MEQKYMTLEAPLGAVEVMICVAYMLKSVVIAKIIFCAFLIGWISAWLTSAVIPVMTAGVSEKLCRANNCNDLFFK